MGTTSDLRLNGTVIRYDNSLLDPMQPRLFDTDWLESNSYLQGSTRGRSQAHFLTYANRDMVLRHFHRGGLIARLNRDRYLRSGMERSRAFREFDLLSWMRARDLPVPRPMAARYIPSGLIYRADIITERIPATRPLEEVLRAATLPAHVWSTIGATIRKLHEHHVFHSDLNCRNILIDCDDRAWLIDFDKCDRRTPGPWMQHNLDRLERSLRKESGKSPGLRWSAEDWTNLLLGYSGGGNGST